MAKTTSKIAPAIGYGVAWGAAFYLLGAVVVGSGILPGFTSIVSAALGFASAFAIHITK